MFLSLLDWASGEKSVEPDKRLKREVSGKRGFRQPKDKSADFRKNRSGPTMRVLKADQAYAIPTLFFIEFFILNSVLSAEINNSFLASASSGYDATPKLAVILASLASDFR